MYSQLLNSGRFKLLLRFLGIEVNSLISLEKINEIRNDLRKMIFKTNREILQEFTEEDKGVCC